MAGLAAAQTLKAQEAFPSLVPRARWMGHINCCRFSMRFGKACAAGNPSEGVMPGRRTAIRGAKRHAPLASDRRPTDTVVPHLVKKALGRLVPRP